MNFLSKYKTRRELANEISKAVQTYMPPKKKDSYRKTKTTLTILCGIIAGDVAGSVYEGRFIPDADVRETVDLLGDKHHFTDDSVMAIAVALAAAECRGKTIKKNIKKNNFAAYMKSFAKQYPDVGYGANFYDWAVRDIEDPGYKSWGNGSATRAGAIGSIFDKPKDVIAYAVLSAWPTHSHELGIKGAVVTAVCVWMALHGYTKEEIVDYAKVYYLPDPEDVNRVHAGMELSLLENEISGMYTNSVACEVAVPEAIINFAYSHDFESCVRNCLRYASDADTVMAISGGIAAAYYNEPNIRGIKVESIAEGFLTADLREKIGLKRGK